MRRAVLAALSGVLLASPAAAETLLVGNKGEDTLSVVALDSGAELARLPTGRMPHEIAISPDGRQAAVVAYGGTTIDIFDVAKRTKLRTIDISPNERPHGLLWLADGRLVATAEGSESVAVVAPDGKLTSIATGQKGTHMIAVAPDNRTAYTANIGSGTVSVLDLDDGKKLRDLAVGGKPEGLALTKGGRELWVGDLDAPRVSVWDTKSGEKIAELPVDPVAIRVLASPDGRLVATSNIASGTIDQPVRRRNPRTAEDDQSVRRGGEGAGDLAVQPRFEAALCRRDGARQGRRDRRRYGQGAAPDRGGKAGRRAGDRALGGFGVGSCRPDTPLCAAMGRWQPAGLTEGSTPSGVGARPDPSTTASRRSPSPALRDGEDRAAASGRSAHLAKPEATLPYF